MRFHFDILQSIFPFSQNLYRQKMKQYEFIDHHQRTLYNDQYLDSLLVHRFHKLKQIGRGE